MALAQKAFEEGQGLIAQVYTRYQRLYGSQCRRDIGGLIDNNQSSIDKLQKAFQDGQGLIAQVWTRYPRLYGRQYRRGIGVPTLYGRQCRREIGVPTD
jgi:hypothetical protein